ncbi:hypothetical protein BaRGS_00008525, partial [Batillaria attramentaria]
PTDFAFVKVVTEDKGTTVQANVGSYVFSPENSTLSASLVCHPQHVHLAYGDTLTAIVIVWATKAACSTELYFGTSPWQLDHHAAGTSITFTEQNLFGLQNLHRVKIQGLVPSTTYYYRPVSNDIGRGPFYFKTPPAGNNWSPHFLVYGDLGVQSESFPSLAEEALKGEYTAVLHVGDFAYNLKDDNGQVGDKFMQFIEPVASFLPYMTCPGNHEIDSDSFAHYRHRFSMPGAEWPMPVDSLWYSFNVGPVHFISYSTEVFFTLGNKLVQTQYDWLVNDLSKANRFRRIRPWIIAFGHRPMYCSTVSGDDCTKNNSLVRAGFEELFYHYGVDLVLQAHEHNYERLYPMFKGEVLSTDYNNPRAPVQIISGAAGSKHGLDAFTPPPQPEWTALRLGNGSLNSYGRLRVANSTHLYWEQRSVEGNALLDSLWLVQQHHGKFDAESGVLDVRDPEDEKDEVVARDETTRLAIGISFGIIFFILVLVAVVTRLCRRKPYRVPRSWETANIDYGRKSYAPVVAEEDEDDQVDFEIDMADSRKIHAKRLVNGK